MSLPTPPPGRILLVDAGQSQGHKLDVPWLKANGARGAWFRATDGKYDVDGTFAENCAVSRGEDFPFAPYGVIEPYGPAMARAQADHFLATIEDCGYTLPPVVDFELGKGQTAMALLQSAVLWRDHVEDVLGHRVLMYTGFSFMVELEKMAGSAGAAVVAKLAESPLWLAWYAAEAKVHAPAPWPKWTVWQATGDHAAKLANGLDIDVDYFDGTIEELQALAVPLATPVTESGDPAGNSRT